MCGTPIYQASSLVSGTASGCTVRTNLYNGHRCNRAKLLLDPYAKAIDGQIDGHESLFSYRFDDPNGFNDQDSLGHTMLSVVVNPFFDWGHDRPPRREYHETVIYEMHVKGLTMLHPAIPEEYPWDLTRPSAIQ